MASGSEDGAGAPPPVEVEGWELPSMRDLFWKQQKLQHGGQTVYGNVWAGVLHLYRLPAVTCHVLLHASLMSRAVVLFCMLACWALASQQ